MNDEKGNANPLAHPKQRTRILVVDDEEDHLFIMKEMLKPTRIRADFVSSASEAIRLAFQTEYQLFITDISMPEINGDHFAGILRGRPWTKNTPIIVKTYLSEYDLRVTAMKNYNNIEFLYGCFSADELLRAIKKSLNIHSNELNLS